MNMIYLSRKVECIANSVMNSVMRKWLTQLRMGVLCATIVGTKGYGNDSIIPLEETNRECDERLPDGS